MSRWDALTNDTCNSVALSRCEMQNWQDRDQGGQLLQCRQGLEGFLHEMLIFGIGSSPRDRVRAEVAYEAVAYFSVLGRYSFCSMGIPDV